MKALKATKQKLKRGYRYLVLRNETVIDERLSLNEYQAVSLFNDKGSDIVAYYHTGESRKCSGVSQMSFIGTIQVEAE